MGIGGDGLGEVLCQFEQVAVFADALLPELCRHAEDVADEVQVADTGHEFVQVGVVGDIGNPLFAFHGIGGKGDSVHGDLSGIRMQDADRRLEGSGFSGTVDEAVDFAGGDVQREVIDRPLFSVGFRQVLNVEHNCPFCTVCVVFRTVVLWGAFAGFAFRRR